MIKSIRHKKGFELSINFIVMVILSLAMLGVGFYFAKNIFIQTYDIGQQLDDQTKSQIESKLRDPASLVAIGINQKTKRIRYFWLMLRLNLRKATQRTLLMKKDRRR